MEQLARPIAARAVAEAADVDRPLDALVCASQLTWVLDGGRKFMGAEAGDELAREVIERVAAAPAQGALVVLRALQVVADDPVAKSAGALAKELAVATGAPAWLRTLGSAAVTRAGRVEVEIEDGDGIEHVMLIFDLEWPCGDYGSVSLFVDPDCGAGFQILVGASIAELAGEVERLAGEPWPVEYLPPIEAAALARAAADQAEAGDLADVSPSYPFLRALLRAVLRRVEAEAVPRNRAA